MDQLCLCLIIEKAPIVRPGRRLRSSELRSPVYYRAQVHDGLINFNLFQKNILRFYSEDLVFGSGELSFTGILHVMLAERVKKIKLFFILIIIIYYIYKKRPC